MSTQSWAELLPTLSRVDLSFSFKIGDIDADVISRRICSAIEALNLPDDLNLLEIEMALTEAMINAIDHGCLELHSEDKSSSLDACGRYLELREARIKDPRYSQMEVKVRILLNESRLTFLVTDPGAGIPKRIKSHKKIVPYGRGLPMIKSLMDRTIIRHNPSTIQMTKYLNSDEANTKKRNMKNEQISRNLLDMMDSGLVIIDHTGEVVLWNRAAEQITSLSVDAVEGRLIDELPDILPGLIDSRRHNLHIETPGNGSKYLEKVINSIDIGQEQPAKAILFTDITDITTARQEMENYLMETAETKDMLEEQAAQLAISLAEVDEKKDIIEAQNEKMMHELEMAGELQKSLLPDIYQSFNGVNFASKHTPSIGIGGDLYDVVDLGQGLTGFIIADVSGHGVAAALVASMFKMSFHTHAANVASPKILFHMLNEMMNPLLAEDYITSFYLIVDKEESTITYSNAGHPAPLFYRRETDEIIELDTDGFFIGMFENGDYQEKSLPIAEGDALLLFTDCILEAQNADQEEFGRDRLKELFMQAIKEGQGQEVIDRVEASGYEYIATERFDDDFTVLLLEFSKRAKSSIPDVEENPHGGEFEEF